MRTNNNVMQIILMIFFLLINSLALADELKSPVILVTQDGTKVSVTWSPVANASGYQLFYAPFPFTGPESIKSVDMGNTTSGSIELWDGAAFIVAAKAHNDASSSDFSNIELFILSKAPLLDPDAQPTTPFYVLHWQ